MSFVFFFLSFRSFCYIHKVGTGQYWINLITHILWIHRGFHILSFYRLPASLFTPMAAAGPQPTYLSGRWMKVLAAWLGLSVAEINLLDKLLRLSCQTDIFLMQIQLCEWGWSIFSPAPNLATKEAFSPLNDSKNKSLYEDGCETAAFQVEDSDFSHSFSKWITKSFLSVWLDFEN